MTWRRRRSALHVSYADPDCILFAAGWTMVLKNYRFLQNIYYSQAKLPIKLPTCEMYSAVDNARGMSWTDVVFFWN